jgi:hypothetical protein
MVLSHLLRISARNSRLIARSLEAHDANASEHASRRHIVAARVYLAKLDVSQLTI